MSYVLDPAIVSQLEAQRFDDGISRLVVDTRFDHMGDPVFVVQVVVKDREWGKWEKGAPLTMGKRLSRIASDISRSVAALGVPLRTSVRFIVESEFSPGAKHA